mgnify:CR=1 FL=1
MAGQHPHCKRRRCSRQQSAVALPAAVRASRPPSCKPQQTSGRTPPSLPHQVSSIASLAHRILWSVSCRPAERVHYVPALGHAGGVGRLQRWLGWVASGVVAHQHGAAREPTARGARVPAVPRDARWPRHNTAAVPLLPAQAPPPHQSAGYVRWVDENLGSPMFSVVCYREKGGERHGLSVPQAERPTQGLAVQPVCRVPRGLGGMWGKSACRPPARGLPCARVPPCPSHRTAPMGQQSV